MDGDAKINFKEFEVGFKSSLSTYGPAGKKKLRPKSGTTINRVKARIPPNFTPANKQKSESKL